MSKETIHLLMNMNQDKLETQISIQCAPLLTGRKISNLLTVGTGKRNEVLKIFRNTAVSCYALYTSEEKTTFLIYRNDKLERYLGLPDTERLMAYFGYSNQGLGRILRSVAGKYRAHMDGHRCFPHEIGLLLGYPPGDVMGFIENNGKNCLCSGYWKVYSNMTECKRIFRGYSYARERVIHMVSRGMDIADILAIYELHQYQSMTI